MARLEFHLPTIRVSRRLQLTLAGAVLGLVVVGYAWQIAKEKLRTPPDPLADLKLSEVLGKLEQGETEEARRLAGVLRARDDLPADQQGGPSYVFGLIATAEADAAGDLPARVRGYRVAARYFEESKALGFPPRHESEGYFLLGRALYLARHYAQAIPELREAYELEDRHRAEIARMLAACFVTDTHPDFQEALHYLDEYLDRDDLSANERRGGLVQKCQVLLRRKDREGATALLTEIDKLGDETPQTQLIRGRVLLDLANAASGEAAVPLSEKAIESLQAAQTAARPGSETARQAMLLSGRAYVALGKERAAQGQWEQLRHQQFHSPEALQAGLEIAHSLVRLKEHELASAMYLEVIREIGPPNRFTHPWVSLDELRRDLLEAVARFRAAGRLDEAQELASHLPPLVPEETVARLLVEIQVARAESTAGDASHGNEAATPSAQREAQTQWDEVGKRTLALAKLRLGAREYPDLLWSAAQAFLRAHDHPRTISTLEKYLQEEPRKRRATVLVVLGEALLAEQRTGEAIGKLRECVEFYQKDPAAAKARLLLAKNKLAEGDLPAARTLLLENFQNESLTPASLEWRDSLFTLGEASYVEACKLFTQSRVDGVDSADPDLARAGLRTLESAFAAYQESIRRLQEAVERYPNAPQASQAQYQIAEAYRASARLPLRKLPSVSIETVRVNLNREMQALLQSAADRYLALQRTLGDKQEHDELSQVEKTVLRNTYFSYADTLFDLGRYEDAIKAYSNATNRYQRDPEALEAYLQIAACYRRLNKPAEARGTLEQAKVVLKRLREDARYTGTTRYDRNEWTQFLDWMSSL